MENILSPSGTTTEEIIAKWSKLGFLDFETEIKNCALAYEKATELLLGEYSYIETQNPIFNSIIFTVLRSIIPRIRFHLPKYLYIVVQHIITDLFEKSKCLLDIHPMTLDLEVEFMSKYCDEYVLP